MSLFPEITERVRDAWNSPSGPISLSIGRQNLSATPPPDDDFWYNGIGTMTSAGRRVSEESSLALSGVWACNRVLADALASVPCGIHRRLDRGNEPAPEHPVHSVIHASASPNQTAYEFWESCSLSLSQWGNFYAIPKWNARNQLTALEYKRPDRMDVSLDGETGRRLYAFREDNGSVTPYTDWDVFHVPGLGFDGIKGYSPVQILRENLGEGLAAEEYGSRFFSNNATPPHYLSTPGKLGDPARANLNDWFQQQHGGLGRSHKLGILKQGIEIKTVPINHRDIQFLELRKFKLEDIARIYGVPLHMIHHLDKMTFNNVEHLAILWVTGRMAPLARRIEQRIDFQLLGDRERRQYFSKFNLNALMRGDSASRAEYHSKMVASAQETPNEGREKEDRPPMEGGDKLYIQGAMVPLEKAGENITGGNTP